VTDLAAGPFAERRCVACGCAAATPFCTACGADAGGSHLPLVHASPDVERLVHRLNWGAALLPGFWTFAHGASMLGVMFWLFFLPLPPVSFGIMAFLLFNGNRVALERRRFADPAQFRAVERAWTIAGVVAVPFMLLALLAWIAVLVSVAGSGGPE
jgi:hypothetical protein